MAEEALNLSLDELIKRNREKKAPTKSADKPRPQKAGGAQKAAPGRSARPKPADKAVHTVAGGIDKRGRGKSTFKKQEVGTGRGAGQRGGGSLFAGKDNDAARHAALEGNGKWAHDLFRGQAAARSRGNIASRLGGGVEADGATLFVSNLDYKVTEDDVRELFEVYGRCKRVVLQYDRSGRSEGVAEVVFDNKGDAVRAKERYNNVALDGMPMRIELREGAVIKTLSSGIRLTEAGAPGGGGGSAPRTNLTITRNFAQATNGTRQGGQSRVLVVPRSGGTGSGGGGARSRTQSRVVRGRGNTRAADFMQE